MRVTTSRRISAPRDRVFEALSDFANAPKWMQSIKKCEMLTTGPVGKGTRFRETRVVFGREAAETMEVVEWNPPTHYTLLFESYGCRYLATVSSKVDGSGTIVEMSFSAQPLTFMAKLFSPLGKLMMSACRKAFEKDLDDLERHLIPPSVQPA